VNILNTDVTAGGLPPAFLGNTECGCRISRPRSSVGVFSSTPDARARIVVVAGGSYFDAREVASACIAAWAAFLREHKLT
jgi:hypothetical protein